MENNLAIPAPDPVDGLRIAVLQQRRSRLVRIARGRGAPLWSALALFTCALVQIVLHNYWSGLLMIALGVMSYWSIRQAARLQVRELDHRIDAIASGPDGAVIAAAAGAARTLILRDPGPGYACKSVPTSPM